MEYRFWSNSQGDCAVSVDHDANVRIYSPDAQQVFAANFAAAPEVRHTMRKFDERGLEARSAIKSAHASLATERLAISVIDAVFVYSFSGDVIAAFKLEEVTDEYLYGGLKAASIGPILCSSPLTAKASSSAPTRGHYCT